MAVSTGAVAVRPAALDSKPIGKKKAPRSPASSDDRWYWKFSKQENSDLKEKKGGGLNGQKKSTPK